MPFKKGKSGNPQGKPKGAVNKTTMEIRETINLIVSNNIGAIQSDLDELSPLERIKVIVDLIQFVTPKLKAVGYQEIIESPQTQDLSGISTEQLIEWMEKLDKN